MRLYLRLKETGKECYSFQRLIRKHNIDIKKLRANSLLVILDFSLMLGYKVEQAFIPPKLTRFSAWRKSLSIVALREVKCIVVNAEPKFLQMRSTATNVETASTRKKNERFSRGDVSNRSIKMTMS